MSAMTQDVYKEWLSKEESAYGLHNWLLGLFSFFGSLIEEAQPVGASFAAQ